MHKESVKKIVTIVGARPQFIKAVVVSKLLRECSGLQEILVHTGQHYDDNMSGVFFREMGLPVPDYNLNIGPGSHGAQTGQMIEAIEPILRDECPKLVLVYGDTNSTLAGALAAVKMQIPVAHVEAGLRSFNKLMPEEVNRVVTDHISELLLAPTEQAMENLHQEGLLDSKARLVGDVMYDATYFFSDRAESSSQVLERLELSRGSYILATVHRAENTDNLTRIAAIIEGFEKIATVLPVVWPIHPRTRKVMEDSGIQAECSQKLRIIDPVGYLDMMLLEKFAGLIVTDSGGVQKEAFFHRVPCVTLRDETEWVELVALGWNRLANPEQADMAGIMRSAIGSNGREGAPYGDGNAAMHIVETIMDFLGG